MTTETEVFLRRDEAHQVAVTAADRRLRAFVQFGFGQAMLRTLSVKDRPTAPFDMKFFADVLVAMFEKRKVLESIVTGDPDEFRWWPEDDG